MAILKSLEKNFEPFFIITAVSLIVILIFVNVTLRLFGTILPWAEELSRYLFVWMVYLGISYCIKENRHLRVTVFIDLLPEKAKNAARLFSDLIFLIYSILVAWYGYVITSGVIERGQTAPAMEISVGFLYASIVVGSALSVGRLLADIVGASREFAKNT